ncbi:MAG TPA: ABC transporter permease [Streptosporangiaceae bacterium]
MTAYLIRRSLTAVVVLLGVSVFIFLMLHVIYPTPAIQVLGPHANKFSINQWNRQHGFDDPWIVQYLHYLNQLLHGNLGYSYKLNQSVLALFQERWMRSAWLSGITLFLSVVIAIPLGIYQAVRRNTVGDAVVTTGAFVTYAMPDFFLYLIAIQLLAISFPIFSFEGPQTTSMVSIIFNWRAMTLPIVCLTLLDLAGYSRYMRSAAMDTLAQDYIKAARAKGLPERLVLLRHLVRNAFLPMITLIGLSIPALLAGNLVCEAVFNFPGLGLLFYNSLGTADYPVLLAYTLVGAVLTVVGNFIADISLTVADPRIRLV